jgi:hypothetical protein
MEGREVFKIVESNICIKMDVARISGRNLLMVSGLAAVEEFIQNSY